jgi:hypothetical protein
MVMIIIISNYNENSPVTVAEWSEVWTVLARSDVGIVGSNPTRDMDVYVYVYVYSMCCAM